MGLGTGEQWRDRFNRSLQPPFLNILCDSVNGGPVPGSGQDV